MEIIQDLDSCPTPEEGCVVAIGNFDGLHLGHRAILASVKEHARNLGARSALVTFDRHPMEFLSPASAPCKLTTLEKKLELVGEIKVDYACVLTFDEVFASQEPEVFVEEVLAGCLHARSVVVGKNFRFGHDRRGDFALLKRLGLSIGFEAIALELVKSGSVAISSTRIRNAIREGEITWAAHALGRDHSIVGTVERGRGRGRSMGFPTANVIPDGNVCLPAEGVYAGWVLVDGNRHITAINVGRRPTFGRDQDLIVEAHILDFENDLYGEQIEIGFRAHLRGEHRFSSAEELSAQVKTDLRQVRLIMGQG